jgi:hypothetical protein
VEAPPDGIGVRPTRLVVIKCPLLGRYDTSNIILDGRDGDVGNLS